MMFYRGASVFLALIVAINGSEDRRFNKIIGGTRDSVLKRPYMVAVTGVTTLCSGSIISRHHVLTALHCVRNSTVQYEVRSASDSALVDGTLTRVRHVFLPLQLDLDVAVLLLDVPLEFGEKCQPITLPNDHWPRLSADQQALVLGYGTTDILDQLLAGSLRSVNVTLMDNAECRGMFNSDDVRQPSPNEFCTRDRNAIKGFCHGDSGGPLVVFDGEQYVQIGIVSWTEFCGLPNKPDVYVNVSLALPWINEVMERATTLRQFKEIGGQFDFIKNHPYMVSIRTSTLFSEPHCAGSIISSRHILTSRNCVPDVDYYVNSATNEYHFGTSSRVSRIYLHDRIDVAILLLEKPLEFGENCKSITLLDNPYQQSEVGETIAPGWGMKQKHYSDHYLRSVFVDTQRRFTCEIFYTQKNLSSHEICGAFYRNRGKYCFVDRGGPLVATVRGLKMQIGIASWSNDCEVLAFPYVYVDISSVKKWIDTTVKETQNLK